MCWVCSIGDGVPVPGGVGVRASGAAWRWEWSHAVVVVVARQSFQRSRVVGAALFAGNEHTHMHRGTTPST